MIIKMKDGKGGFKIKMFGKSWRIPQDEVPQEVYDRIKDRVDIVSDEDFQKLVEEQIARNAQSKLRRKRILREKWEAKNPKEAALQNAKKPKAKAKAKK